MVTFLDHFRQKNCRLFNSTKLKCFAIAANDCGGLFHEIFFKKWANPGLFFFIFHLFNTQLTVYNNCSILINFCRWLDSNRRPLVSKATALPTEPQPLHENLNLQIFMTPKNQFLPEWACSEILIQGLAFNRWIDWSFGVKTFCK